MRETIPVNKLSRAPLCGTTPNFGSANGWQIAIAYHAHIGDRELHESLGLAGEPDEFDFDALISMHVNNRAKVAAAKSMLRDIAFENDSIEFVDAHRALAGYTVISRGTSPSEGMSQTVTTGKGAPVDPCNSPTPTQRWPWTFVCEGSASIVAASMRRILLN